MKTTLLFFALTFSISIFGQTTPVHPIPHNPKSSVFYSAPIRLHEADIRKNELHPDRAFAKELERQTRELFTDIQVYDSIYVWQWDSFATKWQLMTKAINILYNMDGLPTSYTYQNLDAGNWVNSAQYNIVYDANNNELSTTYKGWNGTFFQNIFQDVYTYDANNNQTSDVFQLWSGTAWVNSSGYIYMYDGNNNLISQLSQNWNGTSWDNYDLSTYSYDANKNFISEIYQLWNDLDGTWDNSNRYSATYDANNNQLTYKYQNWNATILDWEDTGLYTNTYDANNNQITQLFQYWDATKWVNYSNSISTYNAGNDLTNVLFQDWNVTNWENSARGTYTYNGNHQVLKYLFENWNGSWINSTLSFNTYGENNFLESYSSRQFNADGVIVTTGDSTFNFFHTITGTHDVPDNNLNITVSPNPSSGKFMISSKEDFQDLVVYNLLGERMFSVDEGKGQTSVEINLADYGKGIYLISIRDGKKIVTRKVVVQ
ncbi:MAG: T9SS type A sorting domain-containing protein [Saprospiraceae bacterium]|uniref:T9SS type A sorting domain-containing protein n=1 Tax=Candidatus Opimibacter skivensis TaxID=2982028 RepID=A0A9D7XSV8_9BACT|nr:T9SS type A sorting domain-containing protein [Candidatus Opimibacter skivensis]